MGFVWSILFLISFVLLLSNQDCIFISCFLLIFDRKLMKRCNAIIGDQWQSLKSNNKLDEFLMKKDPINVLIVANLALALSDFFCRLYTRVALNKIDKSEYKEMSSCFIVCIAIWIILMMYSISPQTLIEMIFHPLVDTKSISPQMARFDRKSPTYVVWHKYHFPQKFE
jgi:hypothetical protein